MDYKRILVLYYTNGMSGREIAQTTGDGKTTVNEFLKQFRECEELSYPLPEEVTNEFIAERLYHKAGKSVEDGLYRDFDPEEVCRALTRKGETLKHLWKKYYSAGMVDGKQPLSYRQYCRRYQNWLVNISLILGSTANNRMNHKTSSINLAASSWRLHLPYMVHLTIFNLLFVPSTNPLDNCDDTAFSTASWSFINSLTKPAICLISESRYLSRKLYSSD